MEFKNPPPFEQINLKANKYKAFTLAEVLITLVIIGIVAAFTVPTIIANYRKEEVETRLKKFYTAVRNAWDLEKIDGNRMYDNVQDRNDIEGWFDENIIEKHLAIAAPRHGIYEPIPGRKNSFSYLGGAYQYNDGTFSYLTDRIYRENQYACIQIIYDINGQRKPNKIGKDRFKMYFCDGATPEYEEYSEKRFGTLTPNIHDRDARGKALDRCKSGDNWNEWSSCFYLIKENGFKIPEDYPHKI